MEFDPRSLRQETLLFSKNPKLCHTTFFLRKGEKANYAVLAKNKKNPKKKPRLKTPFLSFLGSAEINQVSKQDLDTYIVFCVVFFFFGWWGAIILPRPHVTPISDPCMGPNYITNTQHRAKHFSTGTSQRLLRGG